MRTIAVAVLVLTSWACAQDLPSDWTRTVRALDAAAAHYEALGFRAQRREGDRVSFGKRGGVGLTLVGAAAGGAPPAVDERAMVVAVDGLAAERRRLERAEVPFEVLVAWPSGVESLRVVDPDGHRTILRPARDVKAGAMPGPGELNPLVMEVIARYPSDGTHRYFWPKTGGWKGNTKDLEYAGVVFAPGDPEGRCYCCGLTFEVLLDAWRLWCARNGRPWRIGELDVEGVKRLQTQWFGSAADRSCLHTALVENRLGFRVTDWEDARPGDFVQLWRASGSGHSVVFVGWVREGGAKDGRIMGIRYWSTQPATNGIGERVESFEPEAGKNRVLRDELWLCRPGPPAMR